jgi:hypothetical protein
MVSLAPFKPSCSVYGRECFLEFLWQRVGNDADLCDLAGKASPAGANGDRVANLEATEARDRTMPQRTDACRRSPSLARPDAPPRRA